MLPQNELAEARRCKKRVGLLQIALEVARGGMGPPRASTCFARPGLKRKQVSGSGTLPRSSEGQHRIVSSVSTSQGCIQVRVGKHMSAASTRALFETGKALIMFFLLRLHAAAVLLTWKAV